MNIPAWALELIEKQHAQIQQCNRIIDQLERDVLSLTNDVREVEDGGSDPSITISEIDLPMKIAGTGPYRDELTTKLPLSPHWPTKDGGID